MTQLWMLIVVFTASKVASAVTVGGALRRVPPQPLGHPASQPGGSFAINCTSYLLGLQSSFSSCCSWSIPRCSGREVDVSLSVLIAGFARLARLAMSRHGVSMINGLGQPSRHPH